MRERNPKMDKELKPDLADSWEKLLDDLDRAAKGKDVAECLYMRREGHEFLCTECRLFDDTSDIECSCLAYADIVARIRNLMGGDTNEKQMDEEQEQHGEQEATQEEEAQAMVTRQKGKDVVVSYRLDESVVERFRDYAYISKATYKKALQTIITEYLDGRGLDEDTRLLLERFEREVHNGSLPQHDTKGNGMEKVDGSDRYSLCGGTVSAEDVIADVMERVESAEGFGMSQAWDVGNALKYILRAGKKDALDMELGKAENYLHHALTGEWLGK